jgi:hypothetical protein
MTIKNSQQKEKIKEKIKQLKDWFQSQLFNELMRMKNNDGPESVSRFEKAMKRRVN